jgi:phosphate transport system substrate-binding protein
MRSRHPWFGALSLVTVALLAGCATPLPPRDERPIVVAVSDSTRALAQRLGAQYVQEGGRARLELRSGNAASALVALYRGNADLALIDRRPAEPSEFRAIELGREAIAIIAHPTNPIANASSELLGQLYSGQLRDWSDVGGPPGPIVLLTREEGDGARAALEQAALGGRPVTATALLAPSEALMVDRVATTPTAIGYVGVGAVTDRVKVVPVNNVLPSNDGRYLLLRPIVLVARPSASVEVEAFLSFAARLAGGLAITGPVR